MYKYLCYGILTLHEKKKLILTEYIKPKPNKKRSPRDEKQKKREQVKNLPKHFAY